LAEPNEYDAIFAALKHPLRRRILLLLDEKGEVAFTDIQKAMGVEDTGLMSYHLKELELLISQSPRKKYRLSEIGKTSVALLKKVEKSRDVSKMVRKELGTLAGKVLWFLLISAVPGITAMTVDIYASAQLIYDAETTLVGVYALSLLVMYGSVALFNVYDRHYFSKIPKRNILHATLFALAVVLTLIPSEYTTYQFMAKTLEYAAVPNHHSSTQTFFGLAMALRTILFVVGTPVVTHLTSKLTERFSKRET